MSYEEHPLFAQLPSSNEPQPTEQEAHEMIYGPLDRNVKRLQRIFKLVNSTPNLQKLSQEELKDEVQKIKDTKTPKLLANDFDGSQSRIDLRSFKSAEGKMLDDVLQKNELRTEIQQQGDQAAKEYLISLDRGIEEADIIAIVYGSIEITYILTQSAIERIMKNTSCRGFQIPGSIAVIASDISNPFELKQVIRHERTHSLLDTVAHAKHEMPGTKITSLNDRMTHLMPEERGPVIEEIKKMTSTALINGIHNEFLAEFLNAEEKYQFDVESMTTAGNEIRRMKKALNSIISNKNLTEDIRKKGNELLTEITHWSEKTTKQLKKAANISNEISDEASEVFHALLVILKPSQYGVILPYLKKTFPKEYAAIAGVDKIIDRIQKIHTKEYPHDEIHQLAEYWRSIRINDQQVAARPREGGLYNLAVTEGIQNAMAILKEKSPELLESQEYQTKLKNDLIDLVGKKITGKILPEDEDDEESEV